MEIWLGSFKKYFNEIQKDVTDVKNSVEDQISLDKDFSDLDDKKKDE